MDHAHTGVQRGVGDGRDAGHRRSPSAPADAARRADRALLYLVFSGAWNDGETLWWPAMGWQLGERPIPLVERGWALTLVLEAVGAFLVVLGWRQAGLGDPRHRRRLLQRGQLDFMLN